MVFRGWDNFLKVGISESPHGGFGFLHYRNVLSNYFEFRNSGELGRDVEPWMFDANGNKSDAARYEKFFAVEYMDLHILKPECGIGIHRHRDNQEIFFMLNGTGVMVTGDWCQFPARERCFEIRTMQAGRFSLLKAGNIHNPFRFPWHETGFRMAPFNDLIIYQLHVGRFSPGPGSSVGKFLDVISRLPYLAALGANAIEPLPIQEYPGSFSLGYNGTDYYSPENDYGEADEGRLQQYTNSVNAVLQQAGQPGYAGIDILRGSDNQL